MRSYFPGSGNAGFELRLYEGQTRFDVIYGTVTNGNTSATAGVQKNDTAFDQYFCNGAGMPATGGQSYILTPCGTPTANAHGLAKCYTYSYCGRQRLPRQRRPRLHQQRRLRLHLPQRQAAHLTTAHNWDWHNHAGTHRYRQPLR